MTRQDEAKIEHILEILKELQYGSIVITVHDSQVTQIDTTEKKRFALTKRKQYKEI